MKKTILNIIFAVTLITYSHHTQGQAHNVSAGYQKPTDPLVINNLEQWQDMKFGLFMHWGTYSQWGIVESWSLCPEDEGWTQRKKEHGSTYYEYVKNYENLQKTFNPTQFIPEKWAKAAKSAGMKYVVFTTKHHDGFAMFDTKESVYKITSPNTPFSSNPRANITKEIFDAFRKDNFKIGAYFSKPDWHTEYYWWSYFPPKDRNVNYDPTKYPERWSQFKNYTYNQLNELTSEYGKVDILWLDGGWVRPFKTIDPAVEWQRTIKTEQDIDMDRIGTMARKNQPGIIVVDRTVPGKWENYVTPEQAVPDHTLDIPWESCITMGDSFSYVPNDNYKPTKKIIETLIKIISRGGNYLLNIAPGPNGDFDKAAYDRLQEISNWMNINESAVFATRPIAPFHIEDYYYTKSKDNKIINVFHIQENNKEYVSTNQFEFEIPNTIKIRDIKLLGSKERIKYQIKDGKIFINTSKNKSTYASVFQIVLI
ncbi:alpha-L-fucosidase [Sphingobacterium bovistauri]|uniref:alpha-L-fucosidase n=1 Tax=Sphingobacterium bovistauri TaxID=2781959 RepID=A0ABS7Z980_9SPHI|nr:alpha-L-fucosidase [Sphingobacterium bovistauri]MCA5006710.1 alpha-L-fucosidase [Sphingobacterium bovistauri]